MQVQYGNGSGFCQEGENEIISMKLNVNFNDYKY